VDTGAVERFIPRRRLLAILALGVLAVGWPLLLPWVYDTHDGHYAFYNAAQFHQALRDGQVPVRWLPDLFGGRGLPHFLYYHPLSFYMAALFHELGLGFIAAVKGVYLAGLLAAGAAMTLWLGEILTRQAAVIGGLAYILAPILAVEVHVKGDPPAVLAAAFLPLVLLAVRRSLLGTAGGVLVLALASAGLVLAHAVTAMIAAPAILLYAGIELPHGGKATALLRLAAGGTWGALISAFHWLPALAERSLVHVDSPLGILFFDFREHFLAPWQWVSPLWGYHGSFAGSGDDMAFQIGPLHALALVAALVLAWRSRADGPDGRLTVWALIVAAGALLGTLSVSRPVWEIIGPLRYVQFPWRLLILVALATAALLAILAQRLPGRELVAAAAAAPAAITLGFALAAGNLWYALIGTAYVAAGSVAWIGWRLRGCRRRDVPLALGFLLITVALPWTAVPLHSAWRNEPAVIPITEADLAPERVRLGIRRTTARDDYLPRTVQEIPPRDPQQEYLPPPGARPPAGWTLLAGQVEVTDLTRRTRCLRLAYRSGESSSVALNLHDFPGMRAGLVSDGEAAQPLSHRHDAEGRIVLDLPPGDHTVEVRLERTPPRRLGDGLTLAGLSLLPLWLVVSRLLARRRAASI
jgi:hypothetical protein